MAECAECGAEGAKAKERRATRTVTLCAACYLDLPQKDGLTPDDLDEIEERAAQAVDEDRPGCLFSFNHELCRRLAQQDVQSLSSYILRLWRGLDKLAADGVISESKAAEVAGLTASQWHDVKTYL